MSPSEVLRRVPPPATPIPAASRPRIGYVVKCYPRFSETFVVNEILAREAAGERLCIASLRPPKDPRFHAALARVQAPVSWIPHEGRTLSRTWDVLDELRVGGAAGLTDPAGAAVTELLAEDADVAAQAVLLARWGLTEGVTHLHAHFASVPARTTKLAAALLAVPWTMTAHAKDIFHQDVDPYRFATVLAAADGVVAVSDSTADWVRQRVPAASVTRVYNGLDLTGLPWSSPQQRDPVIAAVGRLVPKKGFDVLLHAMALLRDRGVCTRLLLAGAGDGEAELRQLIVDLGLDDRVQLLGPLPQHDVVELVRGAAVLTAPCVVAEDGDRDGLPTVVLESLALGTPVVSTPVTGIPEAVLDGITGVLVPERDAGALAAALQQLLADGPLRHRLAVAARAHVDAVFDVRGQATALRQLTEAAAHRVMA